MPAPPPHDVIIAGMRSVVIEVSSARVRGTGTRVEAKSGRTGIRDQHTFSAAGCEESHSRSSMHSELDRNRQDLECLPMAGLAGGEHAALGLQSPLQTFSHLADPGFAIEDDACPFCDARPVQVTDTQACRHEGSEEPRAINS